MRFKIDENLPVDLRDLLRSENWDAATVEEQRLSGTIDPKLAQICAAEDRILVTFDRGFSNVKRYELEARSA